MRGAFLVFVGLVVAFSTVAGFALFNVGPVAQYGRLAMWTGAIFWLFCSATAWRERKRPEGGTSFVILAVASAIATSGLFLTPLVVVAAKVLDSVVFVAQSALLIYVFPQMWTRLGEAE
jgi:hypothetical protein